MKFTIDKSEYSIDACYSEDEPGEFLGRTFRKDRYRVGVMSYPDVDDNTVTVFMQHLQLSDPPWSSATMPGRLISMTPNEFSKFVDALVEFRARLLE